MNQLVSLIHEIGQPLLFLGEVFGIDLHAESNGEGCFFNGGGGFRIGHLAIDALVQFAYDLAHCFCANVFGSSLMAGGELVKRGLEIAEQDQQFQLGLQSLKMDYVAAQAGERQSPEGLEFFRCGHYGEF